MARRAKGRDVHGILLLNKPQGISSNAALQQVKRIYFAKKAGHTGALDPLATGMLPICLGEATKFSQFLLDSDKRYQVVAKLGERTTTSDADGEIVATRPVEVSEAQLLAALEPFRGPQKQVPSMYSALKHEGQPLYWYARQGIEIERQPRDITIYELTLLSFDGLYAKMDVRCSKGTYIRSLVDDLGEALGCGAHVTQLHRSEVADYPADKMVTLEQLDALLEQARASDTAPKELLDPLLLPMDSAVAGLPEVNISAELASYVMNGNPVQAQVPANTPVRITVGAEQQFIGIGELNDDLMLAPKRLVVLNS